ncbi:ABC transporter ATP-binding protein [Saccharothrix obliqua]|uniref:ABC transporter ATP-binding protein n=1 Tax=Saccharothrix obliqua TaxID=2861747 RepID=UPI0027E35B34|nr:ATP-binding cassette domain-containing protein [Saccharothrix obliqua]
MLPRLDLELVPGRTVALVGATGAGKTTVAKLIARFHDPSGGAVLLDGVDLREISEADLQARVILVTQENHLFSGTVAENIGLGVTDPAAIRRAAEAVGLHEHIAALPSGYDTEVGRHGVRLSAGHRQLIGFARVFLADPAVLVLDEATSRLDRSSEQTVQRALTTVLGRRTTLVIAHRLSTVLMADRVLVLDAGRVVEDGPPETLIAQGEQFSSLHENWQRSTSAR